MTKDKTRWTKKRKCEDGTSLDDGKKQISDTSPELVRPFIVQVFSATEETAELESFWKRLQGTGWDSDTRVVCSALLSKMDLDKLYSPLFEDLTFARSLFSMEGIRVNSLKRLWNAMPAQFRCDRNLAFAAVRCRVVHVHHLTSKLRRKQVILNAIKTKALQWHHLSSAHQKDFDYALAQGVSQDLFVRCMPKLDQHGRNRLFQWVLEHPDSEAIPPYYWTKGYMPKSATMSQETLYQLVKACPRCLLCTHESICTKEFLGGALSSIHLYWSSSRQSCRQQCPSLCGVEAIYTPL